MIQELRRKAFHFLSVGYAFLYLRVGRGDSLRILLPALAALVALEAARLRIPALNARMIRLFGGIHREAETRRPSGILWTLAGATAVIGLIPHQDAVLTALWCLAFGDAAAALAGRAWGRVRFGAKSLEGSLACFLACWTAAVLTLAGRAPHEALYAALAATVAEAVSPPPDDNLWIPLAAGSAVILARALSAA